MAPIPYRRSALPDFEASYDEKHHLPVNGDLPYAHPANLGKDGDDEDEERFFTSAARSSSRQRSLTLGVLATLAALYLLLFGATLPSFGISDMLSDVKRQMLRGGRPCPHAQAVSGYEAAVRNLRVNAPAAFGGSVEQQDRVKIGDWLKKLEQSFLEVPSADSAREALKCYTGDAHVAGQTEDYNLAIKVLEEWSELIGIELPGDRKEKVFDAGSSESRRHIYGEDADVRGARAWTDTYSVWLNYPLNSSLTLSKPPSEEDPDPRPYFTAALQEDVLDQDPSSAKGVPTFHGYSASGAASGQVVFAGMGRKKDFEGLAAKGIDVKGKVVLVSYGGVFRGLKVRAAQEAGAVACLIYTDTIEDGQVTVENGYEAYPDGPARHPSAVQRGSVQGLSFYPGDPSTPGKPSYRNATRLDPDQADSLPKIPSLPISYRDARPLLESLKGKGVLAKDVNARLPGALPGIEYWTGPSEDVAHVENFVDLKVRDIWNTYAVIPGLVKDEVVVLGNHRDAWTFGAADPNSGTAAFHETVKGLGQLYQRGWRPLRSILLASWDAEEYGLVGSTEFGEDYAEWIRRNVVVYHNADVAVSGSQLRSRASPSLADLMVGSAAEVADPNKDDGSKCVLDTPGSLGSGSDYTVFLQHLGIASTDVGYSGTGTDPVYMYHSNYDSFYWMDKFGDPGFKRHEAASKVIGIAAIRTAGSLFSPINVTAYGVQLESYLEKVEKLLSDAKRNEDVKVNLRGVRRAVEKVQRAAAHSDRQKAHLTEQVEKLLQKSHAGDERAAEHEHEHKHGHHDSNRKKPRHHRELQKVLGRVRRLNANVRLFEQGFIDAKGLVGRAWYKHLGVAPGRWLGYGSTTFPGLTESITLDRGEGAQHEADRLERRLRLIADRLYA